MGAGVRDQRSTRVGAVSVVAGVVAAALVAAVAVALLVTRPPQWSASASLLVLPEPESASAGPDVVAGLYDALSRGQIPATYAELLRDRRLEVTAGQRQGLSEEEIAEVELEVLIVPDTSVLDLKITAPRPEQAESITAEVLTEAEGFLSELDSPYAVMVTGDAAGTARQVGLAPLPLGAVAAAVAILAGFAVQQAVAGLGRARQAPVDSVAGPGRPVPVTIGGAAPSAPPVPRDGPAERDGRGRGVRRR